MPNGDLRNVFGLAMTVIYSKSLQYSASTANKMCQAIAVAFELSATDGDAIYSYFNTEANPDSVAFSSSPYIDYESEISSLLSSSINNIDTNQLALLTIAAHAVIFGYSINPCINLTELQKLLGKVLIEVSDKVLEHQFFTTVDKTIITPFISYDIIRSVTNNDYSQVIVLLNSDSKTIEVPLTNYNWYDTSKLFKGPDLQIMKDVENQYYYVSGKMIFESAFGSVDPCIEDTVTINTWSGLSTFTYYRQTPCRQDSTYIGPPNSILFNRIFNDGPSSSGYYTSGLSGFYIENDKAILNSREYQANSRNLLTTSGSTLASDVTIDANGEYSLLNGDYLHAPNSFGCTEPYQRLHIGDNRPRYICNPVSCVCILSDVTGFKFAALSLPDNDSTHDWQFRQTNPLSDNNRLLLRSLNIDDNPYWATDVGGILYPYIQDSSPPYTQHWTIGYPVLSNVNTLPELAFFQTFENQTFGDNASIAIYPSLAKANGSVGELTDSDRTYSIGSKMLYSGGGTLPIKFNTHIPSNLSGQDQITQKFFGMGTAFSGKYNINVISEENAGFFYSGFSILENGIYINSNSLASSFLPSTVGNKYSTIKSISGYRRLSDGATFGLSNFFAKDSSGNYYTYGYFNQTDVPMINLQQDNWEYFAPVPSELENTSIYERIYENQVPENYLPRFYDGPFSQETRKFLYPNAVTIDKVYGGKTNGIPSRINFKVKIREEVVKEIYGKYTIYPDGTISDTAEAVHVIRSDVLGHNIKNPKMEHMFLPDSEDERYDYDFNHWGSGEVFSTSSSLPTLVDRNWVPEIITGDDTFIVSGRNSIEYSTANNASNLFVMGLKKMSDGAQTHLLVNRDKTSGLYYSPRIAQDALFHAFEFTELSGALAYVLPLFDLSTNSIKINEAMLDAFPFVDLFSDLNTYGLEYHSYNGFISGMDSGYDPLFLEIIGGRRGGPSSINEGGYHSQGLVGDRWMGMVYDTFGSRVTTCRNEGGGTDYGVYRYPESDSKLALFNTDASGTDIWINGMSFAPYKKIRDKRPLDINTPIPYSYDNVSSTLPTWTSGEFVNFNLGIFFPLKSRTGTKNDSQWYYKSGLKIGPFDRDVEIGISEGERIAAYSEFYINGQQLSHQFQQAYRCERDWIQNISRSDIIKPGQPEYAIPRNNGYSILSVIPSGQQGNINILSNTTDGIVGDPAMDYIGMPSGAILTLKTHIPLDANTYAPELYSGEEGRLSSFGYVNNGIPFKYRIEHNSFEEMAGIKEFINYGYSGKLYEKPNSTEFKKLATVDLYGNTTYSSGIDVQTYWRSYAMRTGQKVYFSGYREGSRISFEIYDVSLEYDILPYQSYNLVSPSGNCILSGEMGYYAQADNSVFTEGIHLTNTSENDDFAETYNPSFVSDVLKRIPTEYFQFPVTQSGSGHAPVLEAPSVMKQREYISGITEGQDYSYFFKQPTYNYNKLLWPALSDLETLNAGETLESVPPSDGDTFTNSTMMFSACQGQPLPNGQANPIIMKKYAVQNIFQLYDSVATDAIINSSKCITSGRGQSVTLSQGTSLSGVLVPRGTPLSLVIKGLI